MQAQANHQAGQASQGPTDRRGLGVETQRREQVEKRQAGAGQHRQAAPLPGRRLFVARLTQPVEAEQQSRAEHRRTQRRTGQQAVLPRTQFAEEGQRRARLQQQGEGTGQTAPLTQPQPEDAGALHRPGGRGPARIQAQGNRQAGEHHPQRQAGFHQQQGAAFRAPGQQQRQDHVEQAQRQRAEGGGELEVLHQRELQAEAHQRRAEQHSRVDMIALARRPAQQFSAALGRRPGLAQLAPGEQQADGHVHQEEQQQERLGAAQQLRGVVTQAPGETDTEGADEADQVEQAPGFEPGDGQDGAVEQEEIAEQRDMVAAAGRGQDGRGKTAERGRSRQPQGVLRNRENRRAEGHQQQQGERLRRRKQRMQAHGGEDRQVQHGDARALQHQAVVRVAQAQPPAQAEQGDGAGRNPGVTQLHRHHHAFGGVAQEKGQAEEQQQHADAQHGIATEQPGPGPGDGALDRRRFARCGRRARGGRGTWLILCLSPGVGTGRCRLGLGLREHIRRQLPAQLRFGRDGRHRDR
ncbi:hypothetical protein D3C84_312910 [compost metagenome]